MSDDHANAHYVEQPRISFFLRWAQVVLSIITLGLIAYTVNQLQGNGVDEPCFVVFCTIWSLLVVAYLLLAPIFLPVAYNCWAQLAVEAATCIFWFAGWIALANWVGDMKPLAEYYEYGPAGLGLGTGSGGIDLSGLGIYKRDFSSLEPRKSRGSSGISRGGGGKTKKATWWITAAVGTATSAIIFVLFMVTFVFFVIAFQRHRNDPSKQHLPKSGVPYTGEKAGHEMGGVPIAQAPAYAATPQPQYPIPAQTPVYPVNPTPPPPQWQQSPPPQQHYGQA